MACLGLFGCSCFILVSTIMAVPFSYDRNHRQEGPYSWGRLYETCNGRRQSPINIDTKTVVYGRPIVIQYMFRNAKIKGNFTNNGHSPSFLVEDRYSYKLTGVPYNERDVYELYEWHMHFGTADSEGSEHTVDGESHAGEIHLVHFNTKYGSYKKALKHPDGRVVVGVFVQDLVTACVCFFPCNDTNSAKSVHLHERVTELRQKELCSSLMGDSGRSSDRPHVDEFLQKKLPLVVRHGLRRLSPKTKQYLKSKGIAGRVLKTQIAPIYLLPDSSDIYTYSGSATTPKCEENVQWILHRQPLTLSAKTLRMARRLEDSQGVPQGVFGTFRPSQSINGRLVEANFVPRKIIRLSAFTLL